MVVLPLPVNFKIGAGNTFIMKPAMLEQRDGAQIILNTGCFNAMQMQA